MRCMLCFIDITSLYLFPTFLLFLLSDRNVLRIFFLWTDQNTTAFKEVAIISHPRVGEYAFGFITSTMVLQVLFHHCSYVWLRPANVVFW
jgi:hypothetical protein